MSSDLSLSWSLFESFSDLWCHIEQVDPEITSFVSNLLTQIRVPTANNLVDFDTVEVVRPRGSRRAFYIKFKSGAVIAVKGTEITSTQLAEALEADRRTKLESRPWSKFQNFIYREQKAPLAVLLHEAMQETKLGAMFQQKMLDLYGGLEEAPLPLLVCRWGNKTKDNYLSTLEPFLSQRSKDLIVPLIREYGLGVQLYYYPYLPTRIRFEKPLNSSNFIGRETEYFDQNSTTSIAALNNLIEIVGRMLLAGYVPFSFDDHGIGQCIAPQNVTPKGGICDMGSLLEMSKIQSDKEFFELVISINVILTATARELMLTPLPNSRYEFEDPSIQTAIFSNLIWNKIQNVCTKKSSELGIKMDPRLQKIFMVHRDNVLVEVLGSIYE